MLHDNDDSTPDTFSIKYGVPTTPGRYVVYMEEGDYNVVDVLVLDKEMNWGVSGKEHIRITAIVAKHCIGYIGPIPDRIQNPISPKGEDNGRVQIPKEEIDN